MRAYTYTYLRFDVELGEFFTYVDTVKAISFDDAEHKATVNNPEAQVLGQLVGSVDYKTGKKTDYETFSSN